VRKLFVTKKQGRLVPHSDSDIAEMSLLKENKVYSCKIEETRDPAHHNLVMAKARCVVENDRTGVFKSVDDVIDYVKIKGRFIKSYFEVDGVMHVRLKSIAFDRMDEIEFQKFDDLMNEVCAPILGVSEYTLRENYKEYLDYRRKK